MTSPMQTEATIGRLAPSPTGHLHLGHARSFLAAWWSARAAGGSIVMRIEDLDQSRCRAEFERDALHDLEWLGLDWDGPVLRQSDNPEPYADAVEALLASGAAFPCICSRRDLRQAASAPHVSGAEQRYPGTCRERFESVAAAEAELGAPPSIRFHVAAGTTTVSDELCGEVLEDVSAVCGDFVILRRDGVPSYQLAVVVDDARQRVNEVVRGADLLSSAARQMQLQRALRLSTPRYFHLPLVGDPSGRRLSKRDGDLSLAALRTAGVDPRAVVEWAAISLGMPERGHQVAAAERTGDFRWERVPTTAVVLDQAAFLGDPSG